jgi:hypothetical protein
MIVVSDTSPIRALCHLQLIELLRDLFSEVLLPPAVRDELSAPPPGLAAVDVSQWDFLRVETPLDSGQVAQLAQKLDPGESEALALAIEHRADAVLVDERIGRLEAGRLGFPVIGTLAQLPQPKPIFTFCQGFSARFQTQVVWRWSAVAWSVM